VVQLRHVLMLDTLECAVLNGVIVEPILATVENAAKMVSVPMAHHLLHHLLPPQALLRHLLPRTLHLHQPLGLTTMLITEKIHVLLHTWVIGKVVLLPNRLMPTVIL
jgi:hypothetical protein